MLKINRYSITYHHVPELPPRDVWNSGEGGVKWLLNCDFYGNDIGQIEATGEQCGGLCVANPKCNHFRHSDGTCYLKKTSLNTPRTPINGGMCGYLPFRDFDSCPAVGGLESKCRPVKDCAVWYDLVLVTPGAGCALADGGPGACCPDLPANSILIMTFYNLNFTISNFI